MDTTMVQGNTLKGYCDGCSKISANFKCTVYQNPIAKCRLGCAFSPIAQAKLNATAPEKKRIGQQKQKKQKKSK